MSYSRCLINTYLLFLITFMTLINLGLLHSFDNLSNADNGPFSLDKISPYHQLRNQVNRMAATLRKLYFQRKIQSLHSLNPHSWWSKIKHFLHPSDPNPYRCLQGSHSHLNLAESLRTPSCRRKPP